jgi:RNA polymerase sigma factor (sigma-70 family)
MSGADDETFQIARVLIVDQQPMARAALRAMLYRPDILVIGEAATGAEAIAKAEELRPDVVLIDVRMPDMDGLEAAGEIKKRVPSASVVIITDVDEEDTRRRAVEAGAAGYILKGAPRELIVQSVRILKEGGSLMDAGALADLARERTAPPSAARTLAAAIRTLSPKEREVLRFMARGLTNKEIAHAMHYSPGTVKNVVQRIIEKLSVSDRAQAAVLAARAGFDVDADEAPPRDQPSV